MFIGDRKCIGGGALLSRTTVIVPMIIFFQQYRTEDYCASNYLAFIGLDSFTNIRSDCLYQVKNIIEFIGPSRRLEDALGLVIIEPTSLDGTYPPPSVPHIPLATQSYAQGEHTVSESVVVWNVVSKP